MAFTVQQLDDHVTLEFMSGKGYYIFRNDRPEGKRYLQHGGYWDINCSTGWYSTPEQAKADYLKSLPKLPKIEPVPFSFEMILNLHWEPRDV